MKKILSVFAVVFALCFSFNIFKTSAATNISTTFILKDSAGSNTIQNVDFDMDSTDTIMGVRVYKEASGKANLTLFTEYGNNHTITYSVSDNVIGYSLTPNSTTAGVSILNTSSNENSNALPLALEAGSDLFLYEVYGTSTTTGDNLVLNFTHPDLGIFYSYTKAVDSDDMLTNISFSYSSAGMKVVFDTEQCASLEFTITDSNLNSYFAQAVAFKYVEDDSYHYVSNWRNTGENYSNRSFRTYTDRNNYNFEMLTDDDLTIKNIIFDCNADQDTYYSCDLLVRNDTYELESIYDLSSQTFEVILYGYSGCVERLTVERSSTLHIALSTCGMSDYAHAGNTEFTNKYICWEGLTDQYIILFDEGYIEKTDISLYDVTGENESTIVDIYLPVDRRDLYIDYICSISLSHYDYDEIELEIEYSHGLIIHRSIVSDYFIYSNGLYDSDPEDSFIYPSIVFSEGIVINGCFNYDDYLSNIELFTCDETQIDSQIYSLFIKSNAGTNTICRYDFVEYYDKSIADIKMYLPSTTSKMVYINGSNNENRYFFNSYQYLFRSSIDVIGYSLTPNSTSADIKLANTSASSPAVLQLDRSVSSIALYEVFAQPETQDVTFSIYNNDGTVVKGTQTLPVEVDDNIMRISRVVSNGSVNICLNTEYEVGFSINYDIPKNVIGYSLTQGATTPDLNVSELNTSYTLTDQSIRDIKLYEVYAEEATTKNVKLTIYNNAGTVLVLDTNKNIEIDSALLSLSCYKDDRVHLSVITESGESISNGYNANVNLIGYAFSANATVPELIIEGGTQSNPIILNIANKNLENVVLYEVYGTNSIITFAIYNNDGSTLKTSNTYSMNYGDGFLMLKASIDGDPKLTLMTEGASNFDLTYVLTENVVGYSFTPNSTTPDILLEKKGGITDVSIPATVTNNNKRLVIYEVVKKSVTLIIYNNDGSSVKARSQFDVELDDTLMHLRVEVNENDSLYNHVSIFTEYEKLLSVMVSSSSSLSGYSFTKDAIIADIKLGDPGIEQSISIPSELTSNQTIVKIYEVGKNPKHEVKFEIYDEGASTCKATVIATIDALSKLTTVDLISSVTTVFTLHNDNSETISLSYVKAANVVGYSFAPYGENVLPITSDGTMSTANVPTSLSEGTVFKLYEVYEDKTIRFVIMDNKGENVRVENTFVVVNSDVVMTINCNLDLYLNDVVSLNIKTEYDKNCNLSYVVDEKVIGYSFRRGSSNPSLKLNREGEVTNLSAAPVANETTVILYEVLPSSSSIKFLEGMTKFEQFAVVSICVVVVYGLLRRIL